MRTAEENAKLFEASQKKRSEARKNRYWQAMYRLTSVPDFVVPDGMRPVEVQNVVFEPNQMGRSASGNQRWPSSTPGS